MTLFQVALLLLVLAGVVIMIQNWFHRRRVTPDLIVSVLTEHNVIREEREIWQTNHPSARKSHPELQRLLRKEHESWMKSKKILGGPSRVKDKPYLEEMNKLIIPIRSVK